MRYGELDVHPERVDVRIVCHHSIRRFPPGVVPYFGRYYLDGRDITEECDPQALFAEAVDISGVETMTTPVLNNAAVTASSAAETARAVLKQAGEIRHAAGAHGNPGGTPVHIVDDRIEIIVPDGISAQEISRINTTGMQITGVEKVDAEGTVTFTDTEKYWIKDGLGLNWDTASLADSAAMSDELEAAYRRLQGEEMG